MGTSLEDYSVEGRARAGSAWLAASAYALDGDETRENLEALKNLVRKADGFVHLQDLPETDLLMASDYAAHEAGFAAAQALTGGQAALYHLDNTNPEAPRARTLLRRPR